MASPEKEAVTTSPFFSLLIRNDARPAWSVGAVPTDDPFTRNVMGPDCFCQAENAGFEAIEIRMIKE